MTSICPRCEKEFDSESSMKAHFAAKGDSAHSGSIAKVNVDCENCGESDEVYPSRRKTDGSLSNKYFCSTSCRSKFYGETNKIRVERECSGCGKRYSTRPCENKKYCSFECMCNNYVTGERHPLWKGNNTDTNYGDNWSKQRELSIERDFYSCRKCGIDRDSHKNKTGVDLHVHHKIPREEFDNMNEANRLTNLITLCASCHRYTELNTVTVV